MSWPAALASNAPGARTETRWIADSVTAALIHMAPAGKRSTLPAIRAGAPVWDPATYAPLARVLFGNPAQDGNVSDHNARTPLLSPTTDILLRESSRLGSVLSRAPESAPAHESSALIVAALALQEPAGIFGDVRPELARITAHLAAADALRGTTEPTLDGVLARTVLLTLIGYQQAVLRELDRLAPRLTGPAERAWDLALRLRVTGNWRDYSVTAGSTLLERLEAARAIEDRLGNEAFEAALETLDTSGIPAWDRLVLVSDFSVGAGRAVTDDALTRAWDDASQVFQVLHPGQETPADLIARLNVEARPTDRASKPARRQAVVLDWPLWAGFEQRCLLTAVDAHRRLTSDLALPGQEAAVDREIQEHFAPLALYPVLARRMAENDEDRAKAAMLARPLATTRPQLLTAAVWRMFAFRTAVASNADAFPVPDAWFADGVPAGSVFDVSNRALGSSAPAPATATTLAEWASERPFDWRLQWSHRWRVAGRRPAEADARPAFEPLLGYDLGALRFLAREVSLTRAARLVLYQQACEVSFAGCRDLADYQIREGRDPDAAVSYERWIKATPDHVAAANRSAWLVRYYVRTAKLDKAEQRARKAADAYSYRGLAVLGHFLDARGREAEAELVYETIRNRYDDRQALGTFFVRKALRKHDEPLQQRGWNVLKPIFPNGGERLAWNTLSGPPTDGVAFATFGRRVEAIGLRRDDIIVGVDEWRLRTARQYSVLADLRHDETMTFTVWRDGRYEQIHAVLRERWLGVELKDYESAPPSLD